MGVEGGEGWGEDGGGRVVGEGGEGCGREDRGGEECGREDGGGRGVGEGRGA